MIVEVMMRLTQEYTPIFADPVTIDAIYANTLIQCVY